MKSLNRTLSLVLVLVMVFGLFGVASASSFTDDTTIQYKEAVDVMTGIGAINGYPDGSFAPTATLTRAQAAKLVAYTVLGADIAKILPVKASSFTDVDAATFAWAIPSIEYLASKGIINGVGGGKFEPNGNVTGYQLAKMLLVALEVKGEFTGASWELNTAIAANKAGLLVNSKAVSFSAAATREEAALYCFNALLYSPTATAGQQVYGITDWNSGNPKYGWITAPSVTTGSLASSVYGLTNAVAADDFGRPSVRAWTYKTNVISQQQTVAPKLTYTTAVSYAKLFADLKLTANKAATTYTDGKFTTASITIDYSDTTTKVGGNGALTEVYVDATTGDITIVTVNTYIGTVTTVTAATAVSKATVAVTKKTTALSGFSTGTVAATGYKVNDVVLYTVAKTGASTYVVKSVAAAKTSTLKATSYVTSTSFVAGGTTYGYSAKLDNNHYIADFTAHDIYLDSYGYVIDVTNATTTANYVVVLAAGQTPDGLGNYTNNVKILKIDGTTEIVKGAVVTGTANDNANYYTALVGKVVNYSISATTGAYALTDANAAAYTGSATALILKNGVAAFTWDADTASPTIVNTYYANANTVFLVRSGSASTGYTYTAYKGISTVPSISGAALGQVVVNGTTNFVDVAYITDGTAGTAATGSVYMTGTYSPVNDSVKGLYYVCNAIVDGAVKTVDLSGAPAKGLYAGITYSTAGVGTLINLSTSAPTGTATVAAANGVIGINGAFFTYAPTCAVYYVTAVSGSNPATGIGSVSSIAGLLTDANDTVTYTVNTSGQVTSIYVQVVSAT